MLLAAAALLLSGCTLPRTITEAQRPAQTPAEVVWERELPVVGGVVTTENVAVTYTATEDGELTLVGLSTADGSTVWEHEAGRGAVRPSASKIEPVAFSDADGSYVAFLEPDTPSTSTRLSENRVAIVEIDSGRIVARSPERRWVSPSPVACADRPAACLWVYDDGRYYRAYFGPGSSRLHEHPQQIDEHGGDMFTQYLSGGDWDLSRAVDGETLWTERISNLPGTSDWPDLSVGTPPVETPWRPITLSYSAEFRKDTLHSLDSVDLADQATYLLDAETGGVLWWGSGYAYDCPYDFLNAGVRCQATGVAHLTDHGPNEYSDLDLTLEGFADDGSTTWTLPLGDEASPLTAEPPENFGSELIVPTSDGGLLLDPASGDTREVPADWTFLCGETATIEHRLRWDVDEPEEDTWVGGRVYTTCAADGTQIDGPPSEAAVLSAGADSRTVTLVSHPGRLVAYDVTETDEEPAADAATRRAHSGG